jgi:carboxymethylenebutenolidase
MQKEFKIRANDGSGSFGVYAVYPKELPAPAVIVIQEIFGVNQNIRARCEKLASEGYIALAPDLFWRQEPEVQLTDKTEAEWQHALKLYNGFSADKGVEDLKACLGFIRKEKQCTGKVGTVGFCLGGKLSYLMATRSNADCNVSYYGVGFESLIAEAGNIKKPLMLHIAGKDKYVPHTLQAKIVFTHKDNPLVDIHIYPGADHAFARINGEHYDEAAATDANARTAAFLKKNLFA